MFLGGLVACGPNKNDFDQDRSKSDDDCDDSDPERAPGLVEVVGDGIDQDCDGSDHLTRDLRDAASGRYASDLATVQLGFKVHCGPDRGGDGVGDIAATASQFGTERTDLNFAAALPGPVRGEHSIEDVLDLRVRPARNGAFYDLVGLVGQEHGGGLLLNGTDNVINAPLYTSVDFVTESGTVDTSTDVFVFDDYSNEPGLSPYAGPADLTGDGAFDYALGPMVFESVPEGHTDASSAGRLALEDNVEFTYWAGAANAVGDLNGDGQDDLAFSWTVPPVTLVFGPIGETPAERGGPRVAEFWPENEDLPTSQSLDIVIGDVSGDGIDDLVYANMWYGAERGAVYGWFGPLEAGTHTTASADFRFVGETDGAWTGRGLALGDFDGDGTLSLVVGASASRLLVPGLVYVFAEPIATGELTVDDTVAIYRGEEPGASTARSIAACDTDRDGRDELVIGAHLVDFSEEVPDAGVFYWLESVE